MGQIFIEQVASASDFYEFIDQYKADLGFDGEEFFNAMEMWNEGKVSSRFERDWCKKVISGTAGEYWEPKKKYYPAILKMLEEYDLEKIRFICDW